MRTHKNAKLKSLMAIVHYDVTTGTNSGRSAKQRSRDGR
jgi:hypothetical protein